MLFPILILASVMIIRCASYGIFELTHGNITGGVAVLILCVISSLSGAYIIL